MQAERKLSLRPLKPDLDNANVGRMFVYHAFSEEPNQASLFLYFFVREVILLVVNGDGRSSGQARNTG